MVRAGKWRMRRRRYLDCGAKISIDTYFVWVSLSRKVELTAISSRWDVWVRDQWAAEKQDLQEDLQRVNDRVMMMKVVTILESARNSRSKSRTRVLMWQKFERWTLTSWWSSPSCAICKQVFNVKIGEDESVADLRKAIKQEKRPYFDHVPADTRSLESLGDTLQSSSQRGGGEA